MQDFFIDNKSVLLLFFFTDMLKFSNLKLLTVYPEFFAMIYLSLFGDHVYLAKYLICRNFIHNYLQ